LSITTSSKRYAQAVFQIAEANNTMDEWRTDLKKIADLMQNPEFASAIDNPKLPFKLKARLIEETLGKVRPLALNFAYLLVVKGKFKNTGQIAEEFDHLLNEHHGVKHAEVITSVPMGDVDKKNLIQRLEIMIGSKIEAEFKVVPSILGGMIARVNGSLIDGSVLNKLEMLKKSMVGTSK
jgi:F-type H+-transporting ATPase subunit delta